MKSKYKIRVGICRTPGVSDTESKLSILSSSLGTKIATVLINSTILFYPTLSFFNLCVPQTQDCFVHNRELQKWRKEREPLGNL